MQVCKGAVAIHCNALAVEVIVLHFVGCGKWRVSTKPFDLAQGRRSGSWGSCSTWAAAGGSRRDVPLSDLPALLDRIRTVVSDLQE